MKDFGVRTYDALDAAIRRSIDLIGADDASTWFTLVATRHVENDRRCEESGRWTRPSISRT